ncbi:hypothetical protein diail_11414 [Diaporthe ilicicola]|nr:hypothetical protein diail_11414 [Diaporthe ilicicola]
MDPDEKPKASLRGGDANLQDGRAAPLFNPSTINAHDEGDQDVTLLDLSPVKVSEEYSPLFDEVSTTESRGINIFFKVAPALGEVEETKPDATTQRSLEDVIADNPGTRLSNLDEQTLSFAGQVVKQIVLEATYGFLQRCIPRLEQQKLWDHVFGRGKGNTTAKHFISMLGGTLDLKNGVRSQSALIDNCIDILSQDALVKNQKTLKLSVSRAVTLCDALSDEKRKTALEKAANELNWLILGLDCKSVELYRDANQKLNGVNKDFPVVIGESALRDEGVCDERRLEERHILQSMNRAYERHRESFRVRFVETLQNLLTL